MNRIRHVPALLLAAACVAFGACSREGAAPKAISTQEVSGNVPEVFKGAPPAVRQLAAEVVDAIGKQDYAAAWEKLQTLNARPGLTDAQKEFVASSIASVGAEVQKAEATGNEAAQEAMKIHRANK